MNFRTFKKLHVAWLLDYGTAVTKISWNLLTSIPTLECQRLETQLCMSTLQDHLYKLCYFDQNTFTISTSLSHHAPHNLVLNRPFARTNSSFYSFVPQSIFYWNKLYSSILQVCASSLHAFYKYLFILSSLVYGSCLVLPIVAIHMYPCL